MAGGDKTQVFHSAEELLNSDYARAHPFTDAQKEALRSAEGFYDPRTGQTVLIAGNVSLRPGETPQAALTRVMLHERVGHDGLNALLNGPPLPDGRPGIIQQRWANLQKGMPQAELDAIAAEPGYAHLKGNREALALEWFARQAEARPELLTQPSLVQKMWGNFKDSVADLMTRMGLDPLQGKDLDTQVMALLQRARQSAVNGGSGPNAGSGALGQDLQFSMGGTGGNAAPGSISPAPGPSAPASLAGAGTTIQSLHSKAADGTLTPSEAQQYEQAQKTIAQDRVANLEARKANGTITLAEERALDGFKKILDGSLAPPPGYNPLAANPVHQDWYPPQGSKPAHPPPAAFTPEAQALTDQEVRSTVDRLKSQGHAYGRHGPDVLDGQLDDRVLFKVDPMTQTRKDKEKPGNHGCAGLATQFTSERAMAHAVKMVEGSALFGSKLKSALINGNDKITMSLRLEDVFGPDYKQHVRGKRAKFDTSTPPNIIGTEDIDFSNGTVFVQFKKDPSGKFYPNTMFANPQ